MKTVILTCLLILTTGLLRSQDCASNANENDTICYRDRNMFLNAVPSVNYASPLVSQWTIVSVPPAAAGNVNLSTPNNSLTSNVWCNLSSWPLGSYTFAFNVNCLSGITAVDFVTIVVQPVPTQAVITMPDGSTPPALLRACKSIDLAASIPGAHENVNFDYNLYDNLLEFDFDETTGALTVTRLNLESNGQGECTYDIIYSIDNGGCYTYDTVTIFFVSPRDDNDDNIIEGSINGSCPKCSYQIRLLGDRPGCGATGHWSLVDTTQASFVTFYSIDTIKGDAWATVTQPGTYTFQYCIEGGDPCPPSCDTVSCTVLSNNGAYLGPNQYIFLCDSVIPPGDYDFTIPYIPNAVITWNVNSTWLTVSQPDATTIRMTVHVPYNVHEYGNISFTITSTLYFIDENCDGVFETSTLPSTDPVVVQAYINELIQAGACVESCKSETLFSIHGSPNIDLYADTVNFLCSDGSELLTLDDYYESNSGSDGVIFFHEIRVLEQDGTPLNPVIYPTDLILLDGGNGAHYVFEIYAAWIDPITNDTCSITDTLVINLFTPVQVTAGSDQIKCFNDIIILNGNNPYNGQINGTWKQVNCGSNCNVTFADPNNPNTQIFLTGITWSDLPLDLYFEWSFTGTDTSCTFTDTTRVHIDDCLLPCDGAGLQIVSKCIGDSIVLAVVNQFGFPIGYPYSILWNDGQTVNPVTVANPGGIYSYAAVITLTINDNRICIDTLSGRIECEQQPVICGIKLVESCDDCGNVVVTAVDEHGNPVLPAAYLHTFRWVVYGNPNDPTGVVYQNTGSITVHPGACYSLLYEHYYYSNPNGTPIPGTQDSICRYQFPKTCVSIECDGPCENFPTFHIAGCGDDLDILHNLTFPPGCQVNCNGLSGTLGVFDENWNPVTAPYYITWENNAHTTYVTGQISTINTVRISLSDSECCFWEGGYSPSYMCSCVPHSLQCEQPIVKYCNHDGSVTYIPGPPQITWYGVPGAASYLLEVSFTGIDECCTNNPVPPTQYIPVAGTSWVFPSTLTCFTVRVKAVNPEGICTETAWSLPYSYCRAQITCSPVITVCGCCHGQRSDEYGGLKTVVVSQEELSSYLEMHGGSRYGSLSEALHSIGEDPVLTPSFMVYPNPANDQLFIRPAEWVKGAYQVRLQDLLQREWPGVDLTDNLESSINIRHLPVGIYLLSIRDSSGEVVMVQKVIVSR